MGICECSNPPRALVSTLRLPVPAWTAHDTTHGSSLPPLSSSSRVEHMEASSNSASSVAAASLQGRQRRALAAAEQVASPASATGLVAAPDADAPVSSLVSLSMSSKDSAAGGGYPRLWCSMLTAPR